MKGNKRFSLSASSSSTGSLIRLTIDINNKDLII